MSDQKKKEKQFLNFLGRFFQDTSYWHYEKFPPEIQKDKEQLKAFLKRLEGDRFIEVINLNNQEFRILLPPPKPEDYL